MRSHRILLVGSDAQSRTRFASAQQHKTGLAIFRKIADRIGLVYLAAILQPSRAGQAASLVAERRQDDPRCPRGVPDVLVPVHGNGPYAIRQNERHLERSLIMAHDFILRAKEDTGEKGILPGAGPDRMPQGELWIVEAPVLAVRRVPRFAAAEVSGRNRLTVALLRQQLDEPGLMLHFFVENP